jgi:hypothetical protein
MRQQSGIWVAMLWLAAGCGPDSGDNGNADAGTAPPPGPPSFCAVAGTARSLDNGAWQVDGEHYQLYAETSQEEVLVISAMLEAGWGALQDWFDASPDLAPGERLRVEFYADVGAWQDAISGDGLDVPFGAGGFYHPSTGTAYMYQQPTRYYTRQLVLHEVVHQFHHRARLRGHSVPGWYVEGHAEYLSHYDWDGDCLRLGRLPLVSQNDLPAQALGQPIDLGGHLASPGSRSRALEWAIFRFFEHAEDGAFAQAWAAFRAAMDGGGTNALAEFESAFGEPASSFDARLEAWIPGAQQPMIGSYSEWSHVGSDTVDGWSNVFTFSLVKEPVQRFSLRFKPPSSESWAGGVVLSHRDARNWIALVVGANGRVSTFETRQGEAVWWDQAEAPALVDGAYAFEVEHRADESSIRINGLTLTLPLVFPPSGGAALNGTSLRFSGIGWE